MFRKKKCLKKIASVKKDFLKREKIVFIPYDVCAKILTSKPVYLNMFIPFYKITLLLFTKSESSRLHVAYSKQGNLGPKQK